jgi:hypothetical protein
MLLRFFVMGLFAAATLVRAAPVINAVVNAATF